MAGHRLLTYTAQHAHELPRADILCVSMAQSQRFYARMIESVQPRLVIPVHWDDLFQPLDPPLKPFWARPEWTWPPLHRLDPPRFVEMMHYVAPDVQVLVPEALRTYDLVQLLGERARS